MSKKYFDATGVSDLLGIRTKEVPVPGQDGAVVVVREISAQDFTVLGSRYAQPGKTEITGEEFAKLYPGIISRCVLDGEGNPVFTEGQARRIKFTHLEWMTGLALAALELAEIVVTDENGEGDAEKNA
jgi:hypothetical protein